MPKSYLQTVHRGGLEEENALGQKIDLKEEERRIWSWAQKTGGDRAVQRGGPARPVCG